jgi:hypothetical protein
VGFEFLAVRLGLLHFEKEVFLGQHLERVSINK